MTVTGSELLPIIGCEAAASEEWQALCTRSPEATPFHTPHWARALTHSFSEFRSAARLYRFADGSRVVLPLQESGPHGPYCRRVSVEPGVYGGPVGEGPVTDAQIRTVAEHCAAYSPGGFAVVGNPFARWRLPSGIGYKLTPLTTHVLQLNEGDTSLGKRLTKGHRCNVKQAIRQGITTAPAARAADVTAYYEVYRDSLRRWGDQARGTPHPERLFHALLAEGDAFARLWLARTEGQVVSGALVLYWGAGAVYWHGATLERAFALRPSHAVVMAAIEDAAARGCRWFDFNPSGGIEGVIRFKEGFGAEEVRCHTWELPAQPAARLAQRVVRRLTGPH